MRLTPFAKLFITLIVVAVVGYVGWSRYSDRIRCWSSPSACAEAGAGAGATSAGRSAVVSRDDFAAVAKAPADPERGTAVPPMAKPPQAQGKLARPLRVGINTWAGHAPGVVANLGLLGKRDSIYKRDHGLDVEFKLIDDPSAKFAAFQAGQIDAMWDTVDSWAREASVLAEGKTRGRAIVGPRRQ